MARNFASTEFAASFESRFPFVKSETETKETGGTGPKSPEPTPVPETSESNPTPEGSTEPKPLVLLPEEEIARLRKSAEKAAKDFGFSPEEYAEEIVRRKLATLALEKKKEFDESLAKAREEIETRYARDIATIAAYLPETAKAPRPEKTKAREVSGSTAESSTVEPEDFKKNYGENANPADYDTAYKYYRSPARFEGVPSTPEFFRFRNRATRRDDATGRVITYLFENRENGVTDEDIVSVLRSKFPDRVFTVKDAARYVKNDVTHKGYAVKISGDPKRYYLVLPEGFDKPLFGN